MTVNGRGVMEIDKERLETFILAHTPVDEDLEKLRLVAEQERVPVLRRETQNWLSFLLHREQPKRILELGTAVGYSALVMASSCQADIITVESWEVRYQKALDNLKAFSQRHEEGESMTRRIHPVLMDAGAYLKQAVQKETEPFDLIFLDAAKAQYLGWLPDILSLMKEGSLLVADNLWQEGQLFNSRFACPRRDRTIHARMREFVDTLKALPDWETVLVNIGDGLSLTQKKRSLYD